MGDVLEGNAGGISRLPEPLLKVNGKNAWEGLGRKAELSRTLWALDKKTWFGYLLKVCKPEARCLNAARMGEVLLLPEVPQGS